MNLQDVTNATEKVQRGILIISSGFAGLAMKKIPIQLRQEMEADKFYSRCCITGSTSEKIDWHHNLIYGGSQVNEKFCILPLARSIHDRIVEHKEQCDWIMCNRATDEELRRYSKAINYLAMRDRLNKKYGIYKQ